MPVLIAVAIVLVSMTTQAYDSQGLSSEKVKNETAYSAALESSLNSASDKYQKVLSLALAGNAVSFQNAKGYYSGRCYFSYKDNEVVGGALLISEDDTVDGPLFPGEKNVIAGLMSGDPSKVDSLTREEGIKRLMALKDEFGSLIENPLSVVSFPNSNKRAVLSFSKSGNYIFQISKAEDDLEFLRPDNAKITIKKGEIWSACYYFIKK